MTSNLPDTMFLVETNDYLVRFYEKSINERTKTNVYFNSSTDDSETNS